MAKLLQPQERSSSSNQYPYKIATPLWARFTYDKQASRRNGVSLVVVAKKHLHH
ncbi:hypothetical protein P9305_19080 [Lysinibacillus capsici]|uniref:hypothetical protein n=1 Tax=Lysinibacillus capsici TaxID=2115968 RepID=UPI0028E573A6|nr:hypothetical protein [Lysinibacillus capsici]MED4554823.1 hypothetical protein [Lysinibacillus capsici]